MNVSLLHFAVALTIATSFTTATMPLVYSMTWIIADRQALREHFVACLQVNALPSTSSLEARERGVIQESLVNATRNCKNKYAKGKKSFECVARLDPAELRKYLPSFRRFERALAENL